MGSEEGVKKFYISNASIISSFSEEWINAVKTKRFKKYHWNASIDVEMTTLDRLIAEHGTPVFIKIDVEGYELEVLKGLHTAIKMISFEYTTPEQTERAVECITQIESVNLNIECNYSKGESMDLALSEWISPGALRAGIISQKMARGFGDIYVRTKCRRVFHRAVWICLFIYEEERGSKQDLSNAEDLTKNLN